jgi:hypothetical protein
MPPKLFVCLALILTGILSGHLNAAENRANSNTQLSAPDFPSVPTNFVPEHFDLISRPGFQELEKRAAAGDVNAQYEAGARYEEGEGVDENLTRAFPWLKKAARKGDARAERRAGEMLISGTGTAANAEAGLEWLHEAAIQGDVYAQADLGAAYLSGTMVARDYTNAFRWFMAAAQQGAPAAERSVGVMYANGQGTGTNLQAGAEWLLRAAAQHDPQALFDLGHAYFSGCGMPRSAKMAFNCFLKSAMYDENDRLIEPQAMAILGVQSVTGNGLPKDLKFGLKLLESAANDGQAEAQENLGKCLLAEHEYPKAFMWFNKAAHQGLGSSQFLVACLYFNGLGVATNKIEALKWCYLAAEQGDQQAQMERNELLVFLSGADGREAIMRAREFRAKKEPFHPPDDSKVTVCALGPYFLIPVKMFGSTRHVLMDTGSGRTVINEKYGDEMGGPLGQMKAGAVFGTNVILSIYRGPPIFLGDRPMNEFWVAGADLEEISGKMSEALDGVLGADFLKNHLIRFDPVRGEFRIGGAVPAQVKEDAQAIPLNMAPININAFSVDARINGMATAHLIIDTGAIGADISLSERDWRQIFQNGIAKSSSTNGRTINLGNQIETGRIVKLQSMVIGTNSYSSLSAVLDPGAEQSSLDQAFIRKYVPAIDFPHQLLYLLPSRFTH